MRNFKRTALTVSIGLPLLIGTLNAGSWIDQRYFRHAERAFLGEDYACNCASRVSRWPDIFYGTRNGAEGFYSANCR